MSLVETSISWNLEPGRFGSVRRAPPFAPLHRDSSGIGVDFLTPTGVHKPFITFFFSSHLSKAWRKRVARAVGWIWPFLACQYFTQYWRPTDGTGRCPRRELRDGKPNELANETKPRGRVFPEVLHRHSLSIAPSLRAGSRNPRGSGPLPARPSPGEKVMDGSHVDTTGAE